MYMKNNLFQLSDLIPIYYTHTLEPLPSSTCLHMLIQKICGMLQLVCSTGGIPTECQKESTKGMVKKKSSAPISAKLFHAAALELFWGKGSGMSMAESILGVHLGNGLGGSKA